MIVPSVFPSFFAEKAATSVEFGDGAVVEKSPVNPNCVIVRHGRPVTWFINYMIERGYGPEVVDAIEWRWNSDGSISVWDKL